MLSWKYLKSTLRKAVTQQLSRSSSKLSCLIYPVIESAGMSWGHTYQLRKRRESECGGHSREATGIKSKKLRNDLINDLFVFNFAYSTCHILLLIIMVYTFCIWFDQNHTEHKVGSNRSKARYNKNHIKSKMPNKKHEDIHAKKEKEPHKGQPIGQNIH